MKKKIIGILGGMGPESTAIFYKSVIKQCQKQYGAKYDEDYPEIFIYNFPIPNIVEGLKEPSKVLPVLVKGAKKLETIGIDFMVMPCNTATYFLEDIQKEISVSFLSIVGEVAKKVKTEGYKKLGLLATDTTVNNKIYNKDFDKYAIELIIPEEQDKVTEVILNILAGKKSEKDKETLKQIIKNLKNKGAEAVVLGCTDISILIQQEDVGIELFDSVEIYAEATVKFAYS